MLIPDRSNYAIIFAADQDYRYQLQVIDEKDNVCCSFRVPIVICDEILMYISENHMYGFNKDYPVITIEIPPNSLRYKYVIILFNDQAFLIVKKIDMVSHRTINEYYVNYENIS